MYDKKGRKARRSPYTKFMVKKRKMEAKARRMIREALEREEALKVPKTSLVKARKPTKDAPTQAEQDREVEHALNLSKAKLNTATTNNM